MLLTIDVGNTRIKAAVFEQNKIVELFVFNHEELVLQVEKILNRFEKIQHFVIASVGKVSEASFLSIKDKVELHFITHQSKFPFTNLYSTPTTLGIDRLVLATAATLQFPNQNRLVIDVGTCITYDFIDENNNYHGGAISPGIRLRYESLHQQTEKLPLLTKKYPENFIGISTQESIHSGVINGVVLEIDGFIELYSSQYAKFIIILTGGDSEFLAKRLKNTIFANSNFLLREFEPNISIQSKMIKKIIVNICLLFSLTILAQEGTSSPYSFYGIGDIKFKGTIENRSMGSISVFPDSIHLNIQNPAHYASLKLTGFNIGGTYANTKSITEIQEAKARRTSLDYLAVGVPIGKLGIGFGLIPYSSLGYKIGKTTFETDANTGDTLRAIYSKYDGIGGVNKVFVGFGYQLTKKINIGVDVQYNFGTIKTNNLQYQSDLQYGSREINASDLRGVNFDFGLTYQTKINAKNNFYSSLTYTPESKLTIGNTRNIQVVELLSSSAVRIIETQSIPIEDTTIRLPSKLTFGSGFGQIKKWLVGGEISFIQNSVMSNRFNDIEGSVFENSIRYSLGGFFIPNYNSYSNYYKRIVYRGGLRYENTGLVLQNKSITDFAGTFGLGLPLSGTFSNINIGLEIGKRGTKYYNLVEENYFNISVGLSLSDKWFVKRKFD